MVTGSDVRRGMVIRLGGEPFRVLDAVYHGGSGKMGGVTHAKLRSLASGAMRDQRFRTDESVEQLPVERVPMQFLYAEGNLRHFMNPATYEQVAVEADVIGPAAVYLAEEMVLPVEFLDGAPAGILFPDQVELTIDDTAPPVHTGGSENVWKEATLANGLTIMVPPFIASGERIRVDVQTGRYVGRAKEEKRE